MSHFKEEYIKQVTEKQWDNKFIRNYYWDTARPYNEKEWFAFFNNSTVENRFLFALLENTTHDFIGWISLVDVQLKNKNATIEIVILSNKKQHKKYETEALHLICRFAFLELGLHKLRAYVNSNHHCTLNLYEQYGFILEGIDREALYQDGKWIDRYHFGWLFDEWCKVNKKVSLTENSYDR